MEVEKALVEVRLPTYRRPELLRRALSSLQAQTWTDWVCHVCDDSPDDESERLCASLGDDRIIHQRNEPRRYAAENIDAGFAVLSPKAGFGFVLEDDNIVLPRFIEDNIRLVRETGHQLILRNQFLELHGVRTDWGILDARYVGGSYQPLELMTSVFFSPIISNGALFWSHKAVSPLRVGHGDCGPVIQEYMRGLAIVENVYVAMEPLAVWMDNGVGTTRSASPANRKARREEIRSVQLIRQAVYDVLEIKDQLALLRSDNIASPLARRERGVCQALRKWEGASNLTPIQHLRETMIGSLISATPVRSHLPNFLNVFVAS